MITLLLSAALALRGSATFISIDMPVPFQLTREAAANWTSFDHLPPVPAGGTIQVAAMAATVAGRSARIDVLTRPDGDWILSSSYSCDRPAFALSRSVIRRAVLLRVSGSPIYYWAEIPGDDSSAVELQPFKSVSVTGSTPSKSFALFVAGEAEPRLSAPGQAAVFSLVPLRPAIVCGASHVTDGCAAVTVGDSAVSAPLSTGSTRMLRLPPQTHEHFVAKAPGRFIIHPKTVVTSVRRAEPWAAISLEESSYTWNDVVLDWGGDSYATERAEGSILPALPQFFSVRARNERGVAVRPKIGSDALPLGDVEAVLLVFPVSSSVLSMGVPLLTGKTDKSGTIVLPQIGTGEYQLKLLSVAATGEPRVVSLVSGQTTDVVFRSGSAVKGRVALTSGGMPSDPIMIEVAPAVPIGDALSDRALDDKLRLTTGGDDGRFRVVLGTTGKFRIRVRWGAATGEREFELRDRDAEFDVGEIPLRRGSTLLGMLSDCSEGKLRVAPVPDLSRSFTTGVGEVRQSRVGADGRFVVEGLKPGSWSVMAECGNDFVELVPPVVSIPDNGDAVVSFTRAPAPEPPR